MKILEYNEILALLAEDPKKDKSEKEAFVFLGLTGRGKSTLVNYFLGNKLVGLERESIIKGHIDHYIKLLRGEETLGPEIGHTTRAETFRPEIYEGDRYSYCDLPGFLDTRGAAQKLENALGYKNFFDSLSRFKIILVINQNEDLLGSKAINIIETVKEISRFFPDFENMKSSIMLVVTKMDGLEKQQVKPILTKIMKENTASLDVGSLKVLEYLASEESSIGFFSTPTSIGDIDRSELDEMLGILDGVETCDGTRINYSLDGDAHRQITNFIGEAQTNITSILNDFLGNVRRELEQDLDNFRDIVVLKEKYINIKELLDQVKNSAANFTLILDSLAEIYASLKLVSNELGITDISEGLAIHISGLKFLHDFSIESKENMKFAFPDTFTQLSIAIDKLFEIEVKVDGAEQSISFKSNIISAKYINEKINELELEAIKVIKIFSSNTVVLDEDIKVAGVEVAIYCPKWKVVTTVEGEIRVIDLSGGDGAAHTLREAQQGEDGLHGNPGQNGGNFYGKGQIFEGVEHLKIISNGGNGGEGQGGGTGDRGADGNLAMVQNLNESAMIARHGISLQDKEGAAKALHAARALATVNSTFLEIYFEPGEVGGAGGRAGRGGNPGIAGSVKLLDLKGNSVSAIVVEGDDGINGISGVGGRIGECGLGYYGEYSQEKVLSAFRGIMDSKNYQDKFEQLSYILPKMDLRSQGSPVGVMILEQISRDIQAERIARVQQELANDHRFQESMQGLTSGAINTLGIVSIQYSAQAAVQDAVKQATISAIVKTSEELLTQMTLATTQEITEKAAYQMAAKTATESAKEIVKQSGGKISQESARQLVIHGTAKATKEGAHSILLETAKQEIAKRAAFTATTQQVATQYAEQLTVQSAFTWGKMGASVASGLACTLAISTVSSYLTYGWVKPPVVVRIDYERCNIRTEGFSPGDLAASIPAGRSSGELNYGVQYFTFISSLNDLKDKNASWVLKSDLKDFIDKKDHKEVEKKIVSDLLKAIESAVVRGDYINAKKLVEKFEFSESYKKYFKQHGPKIKIIAKLLVNDGTQDELLTFLIEHGILSKTILHELVYDYIANNENVQAKYVLQIMELVGGMGAAEYSEVMHDTISLSNIDMLKFCLTKGADVNYLKDGQRPLHRVVTRGDETEKNLSILITILDRSPDQNLPNSSLKTAYKIAVERDLQCFLAILKQPDASSLEENFVSSMLEAEENYCQNNQSINEKLQKDWETETYSIISNPGGGDCAIYAVMHALYGKDYDVSTLLETRQKICGVMKNFIPLYYYMQGVTDGKEISEPINIIELYQAIFNSERGFDTFKYLALKKILAPLIHDDKDRSKETEESLRRYAAELKSVENWNELARKTALIIQIFNICNIFDIDVNAAIQDHGSKNLSIECTPDEYYSYTSQPCKWLNNSEIAAYLLTLGYWTERGDERYNGGTIVEFKNYRDESIFFYNDSQDRNARTQGKGTHWEACVQNSSEIALEGRINSEHNNIDIGNINKYWGKYTLDGIAEILRLRVKDLELGKRVSILEGKFTDLNHNNIPEIMKKMVSDDSSEIILVPLNLFNKHAVGLVFEKINVGEADNSYTNRLNITYIDPSNEAMPAGLKDLLFASLEEIATGTRVIIEEWLVELQKYANCGPEVIEGIVYFLTGIRESQEGAIWLHSALVECGLLDFDKYGDNGDLLPIGVSWFIQE